jgi:ABC-type multidrug transport system fused ATPase/permease subunit
MVRAARLSGIDLAVLALATAACFEAVLPLPLAAQHLESSLAAALRLFDIADAQPAVPEERGQPAVSFSPAGAGAPRVAPAQPQVSPPSLAGAVIEVRDLSFSYEGSTHPALDGLSFSARAGQSVAIVGPSGAGKSTLVSLLLRFWDYRQGTILLAGRDLRSYPAEDVRRQIGVVAQGTHLFNATVRDNLLLARPDASQMALERAARAAEIHEFIAALPEGYETWIGEGGLRLSGGERQRLAIARALLKDAPVLILDEATANLDPLTERAVLGAIGRLMAGRTTLIITHRIAGLEMADEVLVLAGGRIVERGAHAALLAQHGLYHALWSYEAQTFAVEGFSPRAGVSGG